jgi:short-subunit dehydrogenase
MADRVRERFGTPGAIVNSAGAGEWRWLEETPPADMERMLDAPFRAAYHVTQAFLADLLAQRSGVLIHVGSPASILPWPSATAYTVSRWALRGLHEALRQDLAGTGVHTCHVLFGEVSSEYFTANPGSYEHIPKVGKLIPVSTPAECAEVIVRTLHRPRPVVFHPFLLRVFHWANLAGTWPATVLPYGVVERAGTVHPAVASATRSSTSPGWRGTGSSPARSTTPRRCSGARRWTGGTRRAAPCGAACGGASGSSSRTRPPRDRVAPHRARSRRCARSCPGRSPTTSTSTARATTPPTSAASSGPTTRRCPRPGTTCRSATTVAPARWSSRHTDRPATVGPAAGRRRRSRSVRASTSTSRWRSGGSSGSAATRSARPCRRPRSPTTCSGAVLVNDWSARDLQAFEYRPLGPFLGKSFATSVSPWIVPLDALAHARVAPPEPPYPPAHHLAPAGDGTPTTSSSSSPPRPHADRAVAPRRRRSAVDPGAAARPPDLSNGASLRTGDLYASGTVSGPTVGERGCLLELTWGWTNRSTSVPPGSDATGSPTATR